MLYNVIDLCSDKILVSGTRQEIALWWRGKFRDYRGNIDFTNLNVTGNDIFTRMKKVGTVRVVIDGNPTWLPHWMRIRYLRPYQVLDEGGHSVDIRSWGKEVWEYEPPCRRFWLPDWMYGSKNHQHRISGPSMWRGTLSASMEAIDEAELLEDGLPLPIRNKAGVRLPFSAYDACDYYDRRYFHRKSKSWKDQSKARKQWAKHKHNGKTQRRENDWARLDPDWVAVEDEIPVTICEMKEAA